MLLVDTNVLLDVVTNDPQWVGWSRRQLEKFALRTRLVINPILYSELSIGFRRIEEVERILNEVGVEIEEIPHDKAYQTYRARGGSKTGVLPDFFIGAHAMVEGVSLLTRDTRRYRSHFPTVELVTPGDA